MVAVSSSWSLCAWIFASLLQLPSSTSSFIVELKDSMILSTIPFTILSTVLPTLPDATVLPCTRITWPLGQFYTCNLKLLPGNFKRIAAFRWISRYKKNIYKIREHPLYIRKGFGEGEEEEEEGGDISLFDSKFSTTSQTISSELLFNDPLFSRQWYLVNGQAPNNDLNILPVWEEGITGRGVVISLIDDGKSLMESSLYLIILGVDYKHKDLSHAFRPDLSFDFNGNQQVPIPDPALKDHHGTRCAGQLVSKPNNGVCGVGIAPDAQISAIRILSMAVSSSNEAAAVVYKYHENHIYSCSWGPADNGKAIDAPDAFVLRSLIDGLVKGRNGKGSIYVFAAGNGKSVDNCNYDGYANGIFALTVGAIDHDHKMPTYMEPCSSQLVSTYSSNSEFKIATTDLGNDRCTLKHGGTSAAAPMVAGILALALSVRPELTWRDVRYILVKTAIPINRSDSSWVKNGAGLYYSYKFGFGKLDAHKVVTMAKSWKSVGRHTVRSLLTKKVNETISAKKPVISVLDIDDYIMRVARLKDLENLEQVTVKMNINHTSRGDISISLQSPSGTLIPLATRRPLDDSSEGLKNWSMSTVGFWGETTIKGKWLFKVMNAPDSKSSGVLVDFRISFWGTLKEANLEEESEEDYTNYFINDFYPPSEHYFDDKLGLWSISKRRKGGRSEKQDQIIDNPSPKPIWSWLTFGFGFGLLLVSVCLSCIILVLKKLNLIQRGHNPKPNHNQSFAPSPIRFNTGQPMYSMVDLFPGEK